MSSNSFLLAKINRDNFEVIKEENFNQPKKAASLVKVSYALEILKRLEDGLIKEELVKITPDMVSNYGTNVLVDLVDEKNQISLSVQTLVGLMIKYSCNSSAAILLQKYLPNMKKEEKLVSLEEMARLFTEIFGENPRLKKYNEFLKDKLKTSRNIYYLFDQLEVNVLGSKSGTLNKDSVYYINDSGVVEFGGKRYFVGAMVSDKNISTAVLTIRNLGKELVRDLK